MKTEEDKALEAAFNDETIEAPTEETAEEEIEEIVDGIIEEDADVGAEVTDNVETIVEGEEVLEPEMIGGMTIDAFQSVIARAKEVDDLKATVAKLRDTMHGRLGGIEQQIKSTPKAKIDIFSPKLKERLGEEFPELGEIFFDGAEDEQLPQAPEEIKQPNTERIVVAPSPSGSEGLTQDQEKELVLIEKSHPDWKQVIRSTDFNQFLAKKTIEDQNRFNSSWNADTVSGPIAEFKAWKTESDAESAKAAKAKADRTKRITTAITPRGDGIPSEHNIDDEEEAMNRAYSA